MWVCAWHVGMCVCACVRGVCRYVRTAEFPLTWSTSHGAGGGGGGDEEARRQEALTPAPSDAQQLQHLASAFVGSPAASGWRHQTLAADLSNLERVVGQLRLARPAPSSRPLLKALSVSPAMLLFLCFLIGAGQGRLRVRRAHACGRLCSGFRPALLSLSLGTHPCAFACCISESATVAERAARGPLKHRLQRVDSMRKLEAVRRLQAAARMKRRSSRPRPPPVIAPKSVSCIVAVPHAYCLSRISDPETETSERLISSPAAAS